MSNEKVSRLLIVEDDPALQKQIRWAFDDYDPILAEDRESALACVRRHAPAVVTMDLGLPPDPDSVSEGFLLLEQLLALAPETKVIVLTGQNDQANALRAIALGAYDFFAKPFEPEILALTLDRAFRLFELQRENRRLQAMRQPDALGALITAIRECCACAERSKKSRIRAPPCCCWARAERARKFWRGACTMPPADPVSALSP